MKILHDVPKWEPTIWVLHDISRLGETGERWDWVSIDRHHDKAFSLKKYSVRERRKTRRSLPGELRMSPGSVS